MSSETIYHVKKKWVPVYIVIIIAAIILMAHMALLYEYTKNDVYLNVMMITLVITLYITYILCRLISVKITVYGYYKLVKCTSCEFVQERKAEKGDYVFKEEGKCPVCGGRLVIAGVYRREMGKGKYISPPKSVKQPAREVMGVWRTYLSY